MASSPAVVNDVVYFGSGDGTVYAMNAGTGAKLWSYIPMLQSYRTDQILYVRVAVISEP